MNEIYSDSKEDGNEEEDGLCGARVEARRRNLQCVSIRHSIKSALRFTRMIVSLLCVVGVI